MSAAQQRAPQRIHIRLPRYFTKKLRLSKDVLLILALDGFQKGHQEKNSGDPILKPMALELSQWPQNILDVQFLLSPEPVPQSGSFVSELRKHTCYTSRLM